jgi:hypothetical protein
MELGLTPGNVQGGQGPLSISSMAFLSRSEASWLFRQVRPLFLDSDTLIVISVLQVSSMKKYHASYCRLVQERSFNGSRIHHLELHTRTSSW